jgi:transaldolase/glucose-6-phosphate isomerase
MLTSGRLERMVRDGWITGVTSNPSIFEKAIAGSSDYDGDIRAIAARGWCGAYDAFVELAVADIQAAADVLRPIYDTTSRRDGYVSLEVPPGVEVDTARTVAEARRLWGRVGRPNLMIKVPGTVEGIRAVEALITEGINVNVTLLFSMRQYEMAAEAFIHGLERRGESPVDSIACVASFFVSRADTAVDALLPAASPLRGQAAVANARAVYGRFQQLFSGPRWEALSARGAMLQRPLWASTGTKNPAYSDVLYVDGLVAAHTVNTMPEATLAAVLDHGATVPSIVANIAAARETLASLANAGVDLSAVCQALLVEGLAAFERDFLRLLARIEEALALARAGNPEDTGHLGALQPAVEARLAIMAEHEVTHRIWARDHTAWQDDPTEVTNRLDWLTLPERMRETIPGLRAFASGVAAEGFRKAVLLGMGGSSLAPEVMRATFGVAEGMLDLVVLDTTDPDQIADVEAGLDLERTLFIVSSKSGGTIETATQFDYFLSRQPDPDHYVVITDAGSPLDVRAHALGVRRVFHNPPGVGGRYSALSYFGLVPAALMGVDLERLLGEAHDIAIACGPDRAVRTNPGAWLGAVMGEGAFAGRDKVTLVLPPGLRTFGTWLEQLIAESTGKHGRGIVPIEGEELAGPAAYGRDRLFIAIGDDTRLAALEATGHPVVRIPYRDAYQLGAELFRWELATAVACHILAVNPFDQPNVQEAKDVTGRILAGERPGPRTMPFAEALASVRAGEYVAITAYVARNAANEARLARVRHTLRDRHGVATTVGFGPRFLHSTGQLHKGGADNVVVIQVFEDAHQDIPIPGRPYTFGQLKAAQALGDLASLAARGRRVARVSLAEFMAQL